MMRVERESAKLLNALSQPRLALEVLSNSVASCLTFSENPAENGLIKRTKRACGELCSRSLMTLTKWLQADGKLVGSVGGDGMRLASQPQGQAEAVVATIRLLLDCEAKGVAQQRGNLLQNFTGESSVTKTELPSDLAAAAVQGSPAESSRELYRVNGSHSRALNLFETSASSCLGFLD